MPAGGRPDWRWVREWASRIFWAAFPLATFLFLVASPIFRPGGAVAALPWAVGFGFLAALGLTLAVAGLLAWRSTKR
jgi:hypothetical protein